MSGEDVSGGGASGGATGDEAAWQDLVAHYDMPADWDATAAPWPDREDLTAPAKPPVQDGPPGRAQGTAADRPHVIRPATPPVPPSGPPWAPADPPAKPPADADEADDTGEHYVPPPPPPLPHLDPVAKGAWTALFGGPAYLLIATLGGGCGAGWAALLAIGAFVAGFEVRVLRLGAGPSRGSGPDNGAVL